MTASIIDGKAEAVALRASLAQDVTIFREQRGLVPALRVIIVGDNPASRAYVRGKERAAAEIGMTGEIIELPATVTQAELVAEIERLNGDPQTHGILVQLPLPAQIDSAAVLEAVLPEKDVDGFHPMNIGRLVAAVGEASLDLLVPCTPFGCLHLLRRTLGEGGLAGRHAVVLGRSNIVGKPVASLLLGANCTVTIAHSRTIDLIEVCRSADILVAAVGRPEMVKGDWIKPGATIIDVGINRVPSDDGRGRLVGDVAFDEAIEVAGAITPVPGGVGPMTVACLMRNTLIAARRQMGEAR
ncbi:MAG: bifunctional methylenetetrahydrofolate dehydrogenase/methenyltetrahydrofolate cyclohydrolase FolD [Pseudomonadota bacterium]